MVGIIPFGVAEPSLQAASFPLRVPTRDERIGQSESELSGEAKGREMRLTGVECADPLSESPY